MKTISFLTLLIALVVGLGVGCGGRGYADKPDARDGGTGGDGNVDRLMDVPLEGDTAASPDVTSNVDGGGDGAGRPNGAACMADTECALGHCVDGVCCESVCAGQCLSCGEPDGGAGKCLIVTGTPRGGRAPCGGTAPCTARCDGTDGTACKYPGSATTCVAGSCQNGSVKTATTCNGAGACTTATTSTCSSNQCADGTKCLGSCTAGSCATGTYCDATGVCLSAKANGTPCQAGTECASGFCVDGVCCSGACNGQCQACNLTTPGTCTLVPAGLGDPHKMCVDKGQNSCGTTGLCDGKGACAFYAQTTTCGAAACSGSSSVPASTCDGSGRCVAAANQVGCAPYVCSKATGTCVKKCGSDNDCVSPNKCSNGSCGLKGLGQMCGSASECLSGMCADGVCCDKPCTGACQACNVPGSPAGTCTNVPVNTTAPSSPHQGCSDTGATSCGTNGKCDGNGACQNYPSGTACGSSATCDSAANQQQVQSTCNGSGACVAGAQQSCAPFTCGGAQCKTSCSSAADCAAGGLCDNGRMPNPATAGLPNPASYTDNGNGSVTDNVTGLTWEKSPSPTTALCPGTGTATTNFSAATCTQPQAVMYCTNKGSGWRLPTRLELVSLVDFTVAAPAPAINQAFFPGTPGELFWASSPIAGDSSSAWSVNFRYGNADSVPVTSPYRVRCVR